MKNGFAAFVCVMALGLCSTACKDTKTLQENEQLKAQVAGLQTQNGQLSNQIETLSAARDALAKENGALQAQLKKKRPAAKAQPRKRRRTKKSRQA